MSQLLRLTLGHGSVVLEFEVANRAYFAASISDRGDGYFESFAERHRAMLADQDAGVGAYHVVLDDDGSVLGRFNLRFVEDGTAELGYRVAQRAAGRGLATATVRELCQLAPASYAVRIIRAATSHRNVASSTVLAKAGFLPVGPAAPGDLGGKAGTWYELDLKDG